MAVLKKKKSTMKRIQIRVSNAVWSDYSECRRDASKFGWTIDYIADFEKWMIRQNVALRQKIKEARQSALASDPEKKPPVNPITVDEVDAALSGIGE